MNCDQVLERNRCQFIFSGKNDELTSGGNRHPAKNDELTPDFSAKNDELTPDFFHTSVSYCVRKRENMP